MPLILDELLGRRDSIFAPFLYENTNKFDMSIVQRKRCCGTVIEKK